MQGSSGNPSGKQPGYSGHPTDSPPLKDWQKNTIWMGPIPANIDPFEEPADSPELEEQRSENVRNRSGQFWEDAQATGYTPAVTGSPTTSANPDREKTVRKSFQRAMIAFAAVFAVTVLVLFFVVFRVREIKVTGNQVISAADIIRFSGIRRGSSMFLLSETETEQKMLAAASSAAASTGNYNYYCLQFRYLQKDMPNRVVIAVKEREACCWLNWCGIMYVLDKSGLVLFETEDSSLKPANLVELKGMEIRSGSQVGQHMVMASGLQESVFKQLFREMKVIGCTEEILEVDLSNTASILLTTRQNFTAGMGDRENLHAKLKSLFLVQEKLLEMGKTGGSINVTNPESPFYSASAPQ